METRSSKPLWQLALAALLALLSLGPAPALAWGRPGHRLVALLAEAQLRPAARAEALRLLGPDGAGGLAGIANWADEQRDQGTDLGKQTAHWHYFDFRDGCNYEPPCPRGDCAIAAIDRQFQLLADRSRPDAERRDALKFLVHLVGDLHQPLHATPVHDKGGQEFEVSLLGEGTNLHKVWDYRVLERAMQQAGVDESGYLRMLQAHPVSPPDSTRDVGGLAMDWALQSCRIVQLPGFYPPSHKLGTNYLDANRALLDRQLRRAGVRLASVLNLALDPPRPSGKP